MPLHSPLHIFAFMDERLQKLHVILKKYWGYDSFRPSQLDVISSVMDGRDTLALMPTGAGKSLLYQVPGIMCDGVCIVVTPLISLMKDQVDRLRRMGVSAAAVHSGLTRRQIDITLDNAAWGDLKFLYVAPERIAGDTFRTRLRSMNVSLLAVDEAHCISQWGYDFRPSYLRIAELRELIPDTPVLALTASATPLVAEDIMRHLRMDKGRIVRSSFARANLSYVVRKTDDKDGQLLRILENVRGSSIVYVRTREQTAKLAGWLREHGFDAEYYHGGMQAGERAGQQERWMHNPVGVMVATNAFGMGIDKANVRAVVHYDICDSLEAYYQEAGRAGRDGLRSYAVLLASSDDRGRAIKRFETEFPPLETVKRCYDALFDYLQIGLGDGKFATYSFNIHEFAARVHLFAGTVFNSLKILQQNGYLTLTGESDNPPRILFTVGRDELYRIRIEREELDNIIRTILRLYAGVFNDRMVSIDEGEIAHFAGYTVERVKELLKTLWQMRIIRYVPGNRSPLLILHEDRLPIGDVFVSPESYKIRKEMTADRIDAMYRYVSETGECRSAFLRRYFGEEAPEDCGCCDVCIEAKKRSAHGEPDMRGDIILMLRHGGLSVKQVVARFGVSPDKVLAAIDSLLADGTVKDAGGGIIELS